MANTDLSGILSMFGGNQPLSNLDPATLSGLLFSGQSTPGSNILGGQGGSGAGGVTPGMQSGPGLDLFQMLAQLQGRDQGGANFNALMAPIGTGAGGGLQPFGQQPLGQQFLGGQPTQRPSTPLPGAVGPSADPMALIQQALGFLQKAAMFQNIGGTGPQDKQNEPSLAASGPQGTTIGPQNAITVDPNLVQDAGALGITVDPNLVQEVDAARGGAGGNVVLGLQALQGGLGLTRGVESGNPLQAAGGAAGLGSGLAGLMGQSDLAGGLGGIGGLLSMAQGIKSGNVAGAIPGGIQGASALSGALGGPTATSLAGEGLSSMGMDAGPLLGGLGTAASVVTLPWTIAGLMQMLTGGSGAFNLADPFHNWFGGGKPAGYSKMVTERRGGEADASAAAAANATRLDQMFQGLGGNFSGASPDSLTGMGNALIQSGIPPGGLETGFATNPGLTGPLNQNLMYAKQIEQYLLGAGLPGLNMGPIQERWPRSPANAATIAAQNAANQSDYFIPPDAPDWSNIAAGAPPADTSGQDYQNWLGRAYWGL